MKRVEKRPQSCAMCMREIDVLSRTNDNPGCPELLRIEDGSWIGFVQHDLGERAGTIEMVLVCSDRCMLLLVAER
jgi:hypothetical protein